MRQEILSWINDYPHAFGDRVIAQLSVAVVVDDQHIARLTER
jgi:hypothetical protein